MKNWDVAFVQQSVAMLLWPNLMGWYWNMYCITKHIYYCTFFLRGHLKGNITQVKYLHFLFLSLITAKISIYEQLFPKAKDCNLSPKEKGRLHFEAQRDIFVPRASLLWQCDGFHAGKCPLIPEKIKHSGLCHSFFSSLVLCAVELYISVTSQSGEQDELYCLVSGKRRHSPDFLRTYEYF